MLNLREACNQYLGKLMHRDFWTLYRAPPHRPHTGCHPPAGTGNVQSGTGYTVHGKARAVG